MSLNIFELPSRFLDKSDFTFYSDCVEKDPSIAYFFGYDSYQIAIRYKRGVYEVIYRGRLVDDRGFNSWHVFRSYDHLCYAKPAFLSLVSEFSRECDFFERKNGVKDVLPF